MEAISGIGADLAMLGICAVLFIVAKAVKDLFTPFSLDHQLVVDDNLAAAVSVAGYLLATTIVLLGAVLGPSGGLIQDIQVVGGYGLLGIVLLNCSRFVNDKAILSRFCNIKEIVEDRNVGTGAVEFGSYIASGLVVAGAIHGEGGGVETALVFFAVAQVSLVVFAKLYSVVVPYDLHDEIERDNVAAGVSFGGTLIALGVILLGGTVGDFVNWRFNLALFALNALAGFIVLPVVRVLVDKLIIPSADLGHEIANDRNAGLGLIDGSVAVSFAVVVYFTMELEPLLETWEWAK